MPSSGQKRKQARCPYGNQAKYICVNSQCKKPGLICQKAQSTQSQCWLFHQSCTKIKWNQIQNFSKENIFTKTPQFANLQDKIQNLFLKILQKVQYEHEKFKIWIKTFGYNLQAMKFIKNLMDHNYQQLTGQYMSNVMPSFLNKQNKRIQTPIVIDTDFLFIKAEIERTLEKVSNLYLKMKKSQRIINNNIKEQEEKNLNLANNNPKTYNQIQRQPRKSSKQQNLYNFKSKIIDNFNPIQSFFENRKIKNFQLIYRASENNFSIKTFHQLCDNLPDTLTLIHNEFGKKFGGYTPVTWKSDKKHWVADKSLTSFIFSIDMNEKFKLNLAQFAIASNPQRGPTFGCCDICIVDNSSKDKSNCQFPISYNNNGKYTRSQDTSNLLTGHPKGQFLIKQWEVFKIQFQ